MRFQRILLVLLWQNEFNNACVSYNKMVSDISLETRYCVQLVVIDVSRKDHFFLITWILYSTSGFFTMSTTSFYSTGCWVHWIVHAYHHAMGCSFYYQISVRSRPVMYRLMTVNNKAADNNLRISIKWLINYIYYI